MKFYLILKQLSLMTPKHLIFLIEDYTWSMRNFLSGGTYSLTLEEVIENDIELVKYNPHLSDSPVLKNNK